MLELDTSAGKSAEHSAAYKIHLKTSGFARINSKPPVFFTQRLAAQKIIAKAKMEIIPLKPPQASSACGGPGADNGNRTHLSGLGSRCSTDELYPHHAMQYSIADFRLQVDFSAKGKKIVTAEVPRVPDRFPPVPPRIADARA